MVAEGVAVADFHVVTVEEAVMAPSTQRLRRPRPR
jgi:hypothetical protein